MDESVREYLNAIQTHAGARDTAVELIKRVKSVGDTLSYRTANFLAVNYSLITLGLQRPRAEDAFNMARWPSAEELEKVLLDWHSAFVTMHEAWALVPAHERTASVKPPPAVMVAA